MGYDPSQPRVPAGNPQGGQWTSKYSKGELDAFASDVSEEALEWSIEDDPDLDEGARHYLRSTLESRQKAEKAARRSAGLTKAKATDIAREAKRGLEAELRAEERRRGVSVWMGSQSQEVQIMTDWWEESEFIEVGVRDFGRWENPPGKRMEQDYDWQIMKPESEAKVDAIVDRIDAAHPDFEVTWNAGEKNWLYIRIQPKD